MLSRIACFSFLMKSSLSAKMDSNSADDIESIALKEVRGNGDGDDDEEEEED